ncbi:MAG: bifunctional copper resistance protein CopD/cytochrome c oxidase assembly protein [Leucobacter sp.]|nr:bifunctional copper resistance protein CopD/cytochrome c oxidase assembly protein [Leucobacter sp.]
MPRSLRILAPAALLLATLIALLVALRIGGAAAERELLDPGALVRYGLPIARTAVNLGMAVLIGALVMAVWAFDPERPEWRTALDLAAGAAAVLSVASAAAILLTYLDVSGVPFSGDASFGAGLGQFITEFELGQLWLFELLLAAATTVLCFAVRDRRWVLLALVGALATTIPLAQQGHAAGAAGHAQAVNSLLIHLLGASVWLGGLVALVALVAVARGLDRARLQLLVLRYSTLALLAFIGVAASGIVSAWLRIGSFDALFGTGYGVIVLLKSGALVLLGAFGAAWRVRTIPKLTAPNGARVFAWLVVAELAVMGAASGFAAALGRTATPVALVSARESGSPTVTPAQILTGDPLPAPLSATSYLTEWKFDLAWVLVCAFGAMFYLAGVLRLHRRGDRWPIGRTVAWLGGLLLLFYTTNGAFNVYEQYLFSQHMLAHMMLTMLIPLVLVLGAPVTLALRATEKRADGSWGGREWILWTVQTPYAKFITHPAVAAVVFAGSLWVFYFSPIFRWAMEAHFGHQWMIVHFLISGYLFSLSMVGIDPVPYRFPYALRIATLFATMASHAFFGVTLMTGKGLMLADWFGAMGRTWGATPLADQATGGGIAWGIGELPTLALALTVAIQWSRSDEREQKRRDRAADRSGDAELAAYNEMLAAQAVRDERRAQHH